MEKSVGMHVSAQEAEEPKVELREVFRGAIRTALELMLEEEIKDLVGAKRYERVGGRVDRRNGTYLRRLMTSLGHLELRVPRSREHGATGEVLGRYRRRTEEIDDMVAAAYVHGVSTRNMKEVTESLMGDEVSRSTVSRITKRLDAAVEELRHAPIEGPQYYLYLDATHLDVRWARIVGDAAVLVAYAIGPDGYRRLLAVSLGAVEDEASWTDLLTMLIERGLTGVKLVIADDHKAIAKAVRMVLPEASRQRCLVHFERNVMAKAPRHLRGRVAKEFASIFAAPTRKDAKKQLEVFKAGLGSHLPEVVKCLDEGFGAATAFYDFPHEHWSRIRTTNGLERLNREIKRRTRAIGAFPDRASVLRLVTAVLLHVTSRWSSRRYLTMACFNPAATQAAA